MSDALAKPPIITALLGVAALIVVIAGAIVTIVNPETYPFHDYVNDVTFLAGALGLGAGVGRGLIAAADRGGLPSKPAPTPPVAAPAGSAPVEASSDPSATA